MVRTTLGNLNKGTVSSAPKGLDATRRAIALAASGNNLAEAERYAAQRWGAKSRAALITKADLPAHSTIEGSGSEIAYGLDGSSQVDANAELFDVIIAESVLGRIPWRKVPFRTPFLVQDERAGVDWFGEGAAIANVHVKASRSSGLDVMTVGGIAVATMELLRTKGTDAESFIRNSLVRSIAHKIDADFLDPANSGSANVKPASITNGAGDANSPSEGMFEFSDTFAGNPNNGWWILNPYRAAKLYGAARPDIGMRGGTFAGSPAVTSTAVPEEIGVFVDPNFVAVALGGADISVSTHGSLEMENAPAMTSATSVSQQNTVSLFQSNTAGIRVSVGVNWTVLNPEAVQYFVLPSFGL
jgi:hypothetical protein